MVGTAERRAEIMHILCRRRHETIKNLADEFGVSTRTIQRDVEALSIKEPIYTQCGRYDGGVYVMDGFEINRMYMSDNELFVLRKLLSFAKVGSACDLNSDEYKTLNSIILQYTKPKSEKNTSGLQNNK